MSNRNEPRKTDQVSGTSGKAGGSASGNSQRDAQSPSPVPTPGADAQQQIGTVAKETASKLELAKKHSLLSDERALKGGAFLDAKDQVNNWCVAVVMADEKVEDGYIKLHFEGWSARYETRVKQNSNKIAPFRSHTRGYSGQAKGAYRDWKLNLAHQSHIESRVKEVIQTKFLCFESAHECTQFIRGELYFYLDSILTLFSHQRADELPLVIDLADLCFKLLLTWLEIFPNYNQAYKEATQHPYLYAVDLPTAISQCCYELVDLLGKIWGQCYRTGACTAVFKDHYVTPGPFARSDTTKNNGLVASLTNVFGEMQGFQKIVLAIKGTETYQFPLSLVAIILGQFRLLPDYCDKQFTNSFASDVSQSLMGRLDHLTDQEIKEIDRTVPRRIISILETFIKIYQPQTNVYEVSETYELRIAKKYLTCPFFEKRIRGMAEFKEIFVKVEAAATGSEQQLKGGERAPARFLTFPAFAEWVMQERIIEHIYVDSPHSELIRRSSELLYLRATSRTTPFPQSLVDEIWRCCTEKHEDITRASLAVLQDIAAFLEIEVLGKFYDHIKLLPDSEYDEMRVNFLKQYTDAAFGCLAKSREAGLKEQQERARQQQQQPHGGTSSSFKNFFAGNKPGKQAAAPPNVQIDASKYLDLNKFWQIGQEANTAVSQKTKDLALQSLIDILRGAAIPRVPFQNQLSKVDFINLALQNLVNKQSVFTSIAFLQMLIRTYPRDGAGAGQNQRTQYGQRQSQNPQRQAEQAQNTTREAIIKQLLEKDIFQKIISNAQHYQQRAAANLRAGKQQDSESGSSGAINRSTAASDTKSQSDGRSTASRADGPQAAADHDRKLVGDHWTHKEYIDCFMGFIEFLVTNSRNGNLSYQHISQLFATMVTEQTTGYEARSFFVFLTKENEGGSTRERRFLLDERRRVDVFQKIMCNQELLDCAKLQTEGFSCFKMLFLNVNAEQRNIDFNVQTGLFAVIDLKHFQNLIGLNTLWSMAVQSRVPEVCQLSRNFLVDVFLKTKVDPKHKKLHTEAFMLRVEHVNRQLNELGTTGPNASQGIDLRLNWVRLIGAYISRFDHEHIAVEDIKNYDEKQNQEITVALDPDNIKQTVVVNSNMQIWQVIIQIARAYRFRLSEFQIITRNGPLGEQIYADSVSQYVIKNVTIQRVDEAAFNQENPRRIIGQDKSFVKKLVGLLIEMADQEVVVREIIQLVESLPVNADMRDELAERVGTIKPSKSSDNLQQWSELFSWDPKGANASKLPPTAYHMLRMLYDMIRESPFRMTSTAPAEQEAHEKAQRVEFCKAFISQGGFQFLVTFFTALEKAGLESNALNNKALTMLLELLQHFFGQRMYPYVKDLFTEQLLFNLFNQNMRIIQNFVQAVHLQQTQGAQLNQQQISLKNETHLIQLSLQLMQKMLSLQPNLIRVFYEFPNVDKIFMTVFTALETESIQQKVSATLLDICKKLDQDFPASENVQADGNGLPAAVAQNLPSVYFMKLIWTKFLPKAFTFSAKTGATKELFNFANKLMVETVVFQYLDIIQPVVQFSDDLRKMIQDRPLIEADGDPRSEDVVLAGMFTYLKNIMRKRPEARVHLQQDPAFLNYLLHDCLFYKETNINMVSKDAVGPPKCKTRNTRTFCLSLVKELTVENAAGIRALVDYMRQNIYSSNVSWFWRTPRGTDWAITTANKQEKSSTGFVGLKNIACICYMNSIMQNLFMIPAFKKAMLEVEDQQRGVPNSENVIYQIKRIFGALMELEKQYFNPKKFCFAFKDIDGSPIDPYIQKDVDEFFNMLIDRIENLIKGTKEERAMKNLFYGNFANELIVQGCSHYSEREEQFMAIPLQVKNKASVLESLENFVEGEMLEGDNAYHCEKCDKKRDTLKRCSIKQLPNILFLELKRFEFNFDTMSKTKVNDYCSFPMELDMRPYGQDHIAKKDLQKEMEAKNWTTEDLNEDQLVILNRQITQQYYQYHLKGVVVHNGTSDSGHYYTFIKDREGSGDDTWYEFNDTHVQHFNPSDIPAETFGGENENWEVDLARHQHDPAMQQLLQSQGRVKTKSAYILIYERECFIDQDKFHEFTEDVNAVMQNQAPGAYEKASARQFNVCRLPQTVSTQIQIPPTIHESILEKNRRFWLTRFIFNKTFLEQSLEIFRNCLFTAEQEYAVAKTSDLHRVFEVGSDGDTLEVLKYIVTFTLTVAFRASVRAQIPFFVRIIRKALKSNLALCIWLCEIFSNQQIIKEFFVDCTIGDMSRFTAGLLKTAMQQIYKHEAEWIQKYIEQMDAGSVTAYIRQTNGDKIANLREKVNCAQPGSPADGGVQTPGQAEKPGHEQVGSSEPQQIYTPSTYVDVFTMTHGSKPELPMLIMFINSFLHWQGSPELMSNFAMSINLHSVVFHFCELGPVARLYLLKTKTLGRLTRILGLSTTTPTAQDLGSQMHQSMPLFQLDYSNSGVYFTPSMMQVDDKVTEKEKRQNAANAQPPNIFIISTISSLVRSCQFLSQTQPNGANPAHHKNGPLFNGMVYNDQDGHKLDKDEVDLLINYIAHRVWWRSPSQEYKMLRNAGATMWAHIAFDNIQFSHLYIQEMFKAINGANFMVVKKYERPLLSLVKLRDAYQKQRINIVLNNLYDVFRKSTQFWKFCDQLIELTYKLTLRNRMFAQELSKNQNLYRMIEQITRENPSFPYNQQRIKIFKEGVINWTHQNNKKNLLNQTRVDHITKYSKQRLANLARAIEAGKLPGGPDQQDDQSAQHQEETTELGDDSDDDCYGHLFREGEYVDAYFSRNTTPGWYQAKVVFALEEMIKVQTTMPSGTKHDCWVELESASLAWLNTYTKNDKSENFAFFQELYKLIEPAGSAEQPQQQQPPGSRQQQSRQ